MIKILTESESEDWKTYLSSESMFLPIKGDTK